MKRESVIFLAAAAACFGLAWLTFEWRDGLMKEDASVTAELADFRQLTVRAEERTADETEAVYGHVFKEENEQETSEEEEQREDLAGAATETVPEGGPVVESETGLNPAEVDGTEECDASVRDLPASETFPLYSVAGDVLDEGLQEYLFRKLDETGIAFWMPYAVAQAYQESSFDWHQVTNGIDCGLFQYRIYYWDEWCDRAGVGHGDIFDPYRQIDVYTEMVRQWLAAGCSESRTISNHNTGGWDDQISEEYIRDVTSWFPVTMRIK